MIKPWEGKHMWIWQMENTEGGNVASVISKAKAMGLAWLAVKAWDGSHYWSQIEKFIAPAHAAGLMVAAWGYSYGSNIPGEVQAMVQAGKAGTDWFIIDAEIEYESAGGKDRAASLLSAVAKSSIGYATFGYTSFGLPAYHPSFPFDVFSAHCQAALPQIYWGDFKMTPASALSQSLAAYGKNKLPIVPVGQSYGSVSAAEIQTFGASAAAAVAPGIGFWDWQEATPAMMDAIKALSLVAPKAPASGASDWAKASWAKAVARGIVDDTAPQGAVTREMLAAVLDKLGMIK